MFITFDFISNKFLNFNDVEYVNNLLDTKSKIYGFNRRLRTAF